MNRNYKVIWNASLNCFMAVSEYAKARGKSSKSGVSSNATTVSTLSLTKAFRLTTLGLGLITVGLTMSPQVFAVSGIGGGVSIGIGNSNCSPAASTAGTSSVAVGCGAVADTTNTGITFYDRANPYNTTVDITTGRYYSVAVGAQAKAVEAGTSVGMLSESGELGVAFGAQAKSRNIAAVAIGPAALATGNTALALGRQSAATADFAQAIGNVSAATGIGSLAMGHSATATGSRSIAIGAADIGSAGSTGDQAGVKYQTAERTYSSGKDSIALGAAANSTKDYALAIGAKSKADGVNSTAVGFNSQATGLDSFAIGGHSKALAKNALALGGSAQADKENSIAVGVGAKANFINSVALGAGSQVLHNNSTAIGDGSTTNAYSQTAFLYNSSDTGAIATGAVSVGKGTGTGATNERRLQNVAAGALDTDGVNVSQLKKYTVITDAAIKASKTEVKAGTNVTVPPAATGNNGQNIYTINANGTTASEGSEAVTVVGTDVGGNVTNYKVDLSAKSKKSLADADSAMQTLVTQVDGLKDKALTKADNKANFASGKNILLTRELDGSIKVATKDEVEFKKVTVKDGASSSIVEATQVIVGGANPVTISGVNGTVKGLTNKTWNGTTIVSGQAATEDQLQIASRALVTKGMNFVGNDGQVINKMLGDTLGIEGGMTTGASSSVNTKTVKKNNGALEIQLAKNLTDLDSITINNGGPIISRMGINMGSNVDVNGSPTNRITNLGKGLVGTDAVNVSQLNEAEINLTNLGLNFTGDDTIDVINRKLGQTLTIKGGASGNLTTGNIGVVKDGDNLDVKLAEKINLGTNGSVTTGNTVMNTGGVTFLGGTPATTVSLTSTGLNNGGNQITNVASGGTNSTNAANIGDVQNSVAANKTKYYSVNSSGGTNDLNEGATGQNAMAMGRNAVASGSQAISIGSSASGQKTTASGEQSISIGANSVSTGASSIAIGGDDLDAASKANLTGAASGTVNGGSVNAKFNAYTARSLVETPPYQISTESGGAASIAMGAKALSKGALSTAIGVQSSSAGIASSALGVGSSAMAEGSVALGAGSVANVVGGAAGYVPIGASTAATNAIKATQSGTIYGAVSVGSGTNGGTRQIVNLAAGTADSDAVNVAQLKGGISGVVDLGLNFGGDSGTDVNRKLGQKLIIKGGDTINADSATKNISVTANGDDTLTVRLAKDINLGNTGSVTAGNTQINNAGITLYHGSNGQVVLTNNGLSNGNNKITNVAAGSLSATSTDAVNGSQLFKTNEDVAKGIKFELNGTTKTYALGEAIQVATDANITTTAFGNGAKFSLADTIKIGGTSANAVSIDGTAGIVKGLTNTTFDANATYTGGQAATQEQLSGLQSGISNTFDKGISFGGDNAPITIKRKLGEKIIVKGGVDDSAKLTDSNIGVIADGTDTLTVKLAKDLTGLNSASFGNDVMISSAGLRAGATLVNTGGVSFSGSTVSLNSSGLNNGGNTITNVKRGSELTDAVNVEQLNEVKQSAESANKGWNVSAQGVNASTVKPSDTVDLNNTDNNITVSKSAESNNISFNLSKDVAVDSVKTGAATLDSNGLTIAGGPTFTKTSVDAGSNKITNVANGAIEVNSKDAVNGSQLFEFVSLVNTQTTAIAEIGAGLNFDADTGPVINKKAGSNPLSFKGGNNITTTAEGSSIKFDLNGNINVDSVTTGNTTVNNSGVTIKNGPSMTAAGVYAGNAETAPSMTAAGINAAGTKVTNVADGMAPRDAVNFGQLEAVSRGLGNSINELGYKIGEVEDDANAGISAAMAMSSLPQAYIIGKPMIGGGIATYNGESAVAIGFSKMSNDGRWVMKLNGTADTQGNVGAAIGAGFHFD